MKISEIMEGVKDEDDDFRFEVQKRIKPWGQAKDDPENKSDSARKMKDIMKRSNQMGHSGSVTQAVDVYPAL
jgi:hypothetical protein